MAAALARPAYAESAEDLVTPSWRNAGMLQFKVANRGVHSVSVLVNTYARDGRVDRQIFEMTPGDSRGAFPNTSGFQMWESPKISYAHNQWSRSRGNIDRIEFSYVVRKTGADGQRKPIESRKVYSYTGQNEAGAMSFNTGRFQAVADNSGRGLDRQDPRDVQAAVDRLAKKPPAGDYKTLPGTFPHPMHPINDLIKAVTSVTGMKKKNPSGEYFIRFSIYNQDNMDLSRALVTAHKAGVKVEGITDRSQVTPHLASKPAYETVRQAGIPMFSMVRNNPTNGDIRTNHTKFWIMGQMKNGKIARANTFDCSFNTEFGNYPNNQESMMAFRKNRDVATVYNHFFQTMKGSAPLKLVIDPARAKFILNHPLYPYVTPKGKAYSARDAMYTFIGKARRSLTMLDYVAADPDIAGAVGARAQKGVKVHAFLNSYWGAQGDSQSHKMRSMGANVHLTHLENGGSPIHHKEGAADRWVRGGSLNPGWWSFESDETMYVIKSKKLARQVRAQANRLAHNYHNTDMSGSQRPAKKLQPVQFEVRLPNGINSRDVAGVYVKGEGGSGELDREWVTLKKVRTRGNKTIYRGSRQLPLGFIHKGRPVIQMTSGKQIESARGGMFQVSPRSRGRQRIRMGFKPRPGR